MNNLGNDGHLSSSEEETILLNTEGNIIPGNSTNNTFINPNTLPIFNYRDEIVKKVKDNQFLVIRGDTGCGKTTQIPKYLFNAKLNGNQLIGISQPRRLAAINVSKHVAKEMKCPWGTTVGYEIRFDRKMDASTKIKFMTDGIMLNECILDPKLKDYKILIIDEAHERTLVSDTVMGLLKQIAKKREDIKILITSATISTDRFSQYFDDCPIIDINAINMFHIDIQYSDYVADMIKSSADLVRQIHKIRPLPGDILVFLPGKREINDCCDKLKGIDDLKVLKLHSEMDYDKQKTVLQLRNNTDELRHVIIATNIAETSLTVPNIAYVVDCGYAKQNWFNLNRGLEILEMKRISKSQANQRRGRAGRVMAGICYRLYDEETFDDMDDEILPEIMRKSFDEVYLKILALNINPTEFDLLDNPSPESLEYCAQKLMKLNLLTQNDDDGDNYKITNVGKQLAQLPLDPIRASTILKSFTNNCQDAIIAIISMFEEKMIFQDKDNQLKQGRYDQFYDCDGDHFVLWNIFKAYRKSLKRKQWCNEHYINYQTMVKITHIYNQIKMILKRIGLNFDQCDDVNKVAVKKCFVEGYFLNISIKQKMGSYKCVSNSEICFIHNSSFLHNNAPEILLFGEIWRMDKIFIRGIMALDEEFLRDNFQVILNKINFPEDVNDFDFGFPTL